MLEIINLSKTFINNDGSRLNVLKNINCNIKKGEVISIIGPSGTGKSTFLRCINKIENPTAGQILFNGTDILNPKTDINKVRKKIGMVFQSFNLFNHFTILENVMFGPEKLLNVPKEEAQKKSMEILRDVGMADKANEYPSVLSGGQKQRVAIARCLAMEPEMILFDEPTSALDPTMVGEVLSVIRQLANKGMTILIVTHEMKFAKDVSSRILFMYGGGILEDGTPDQIFNHPVHQETSAFINRLRTLHFDFNLQNTDLYATNTAIDAFCLKYGATHQRFNIELIFEELMFNLVPDHDDVSLDIEYSELKYNISCTFLFKGISKTVLDDEDSISARLVKGMCNNFKETVTKDGLMIQIS